MTYTRAFVPYKNFKSRSDAQQAMVEAATNGTWRDVGILAVDERVVWTFDDDGIWLRFREERSA